MRSTPVTLPPSRISRIRRSRRPTASEESAVVLPCTRTCVIPGREISIFELGRARSPGAIRLALISRGTPGDKRIQPRAGLLDARRSGRDCARCAAARFAPQRFVRGGRTRPRVRDQRGQFFARVRRGPVPCRGLDVPEGLCRNIGGARRMRQLAPLSVGTLRRRFSAVASGSYLTATISSSSSRRA